MPYDAESVKSANAFAEAELKQCTVKLPAYNELFIDVDGKPTTGPDWFAFNFSKLEQHLQAVIVSDTPSPSGEEGHRHIVVACNRKIEPFERLLLQAILGSDLQREALSWIRVISNDPNPTLFFEKKPLQLSNGAPTVAQEPSVGAQ